MSTYRPDIDGLRALAVLGVLGFHALPQNVPGGFIGVDVFFVVSGYLISGIIVSALDNGRFSYRAFYARRIRRIFPALFLVLTATYVFGWLALFPDEFASLGMHVASGAGFLANITLWHESGYFDTAADLKPLLHLWSLGVEEQFYIVWPVVLSMFVRSPRALAGAMFLLFSASFVLNVTFVGRSPDATFFLPVTRFWEIILGALLSLAEMRGRPLVSLLMGRREARLEGTIRDALSWAGLGLMVSALLLIDRHRTFPGWWALLPTLGTCCVIAAGPTSWLNRRVLGSRGLVAIGLISYPLYLWHWPLLAFGRILRGGPLPPSTAIGLVALSVMLASLTYLVVERRIRFGARQGSVVVSLGVAMLAVAIAGVGAAQHRVVARSSSGDLQGFWNATTDWAFPNPNLEQVNVNGLSAFVVRGGDTPHVLFFGDSNIEQFLPRISDLIHNDPSGYENAYFATTGGCPPIPGVREKNHPDCPDFVARALDLARSPQVERVVVGACWYCYFLIEGGPESRFDYYYEKDGARAPLRSGLEGGEGALAALGEMLTRLSATKTTYLILNVPSGSALDPRRMISRDLLGRGFVVDTSGLNLSAFLTQYGRLRQRLTAIAKSAGAHVIDPIDFLCGDRICASVTDNGEPIYKDAAHLRASFVRNRVTFLDDTVRRH
jgi:peptidoglycan/LPS O-acetylase OafA/YrhL